MSNYLYCISSGKIEAISLTSRSSPPDKPEKVKKKRETDRMTYPWLASYVKTGEYRYKVYGAVYPPSQTWVYETPSLTHLLLSNQYSPAQSNADLAVS